MITMITVKMKKRAAELRLARARAALVALKRCGYPVIESA